MKKINKLTKKEVIPKDRLNCTQNIGHIN